MEFAIQSSIQSFFNSWIIKHPFVFWLWQHPIISVVGLFLGVVLLLRLFSVIAKLVDLLWIWLLKSPITLVKSLLGLKNKSTATTAIIRTQNLSIDSEKITQIIQQLELINHQQQQIMEDIAILKKQSDL
jgi:hypothetical protein